MTTRSKRARQGSRWFRGALILVNGALVTACLAGAGTFGYFYWQLESVPRQSFAPDVLEEPEPGRPVNILLVGSDSRAFVEGSDDRESFGDPEEQSGQRADSIIVLRLDPAVPAASMLSIPRDLYVTLADGTEDRINVSFANGPGELIETIDANLGIPINHYMQVDFAGFKGLVEAVGGVTLYLENWVRDRDAFGDNPTGLDIRRTGCVEMHGNEALAYARSRHFEERIDGEWVSDLRGDLGRIDRQQRFLREAADEVIGAGLLDPRRVNDLIDVADDNLVIDDELGYGEIVELVQRFSNVDPDEVTMFSLPVENERIPETPTATAKWVVIPLEGAPAVVDAFLDRPAEPVDPSAALQPAEVTVRVSNGTGTAGQAAAAGAALTAVGFVVGPPVDAPDAAITVVRHGADDAGRAAGALVASYLESGADLVVDGAIDDAVELVTGADWAGVRSTPAPQPTTTTTTVPTTTTTVPAPEPC